jgi:hypothetical protein
VARKNLIRSFDGWQVRGGHVNASLFVGTSRMEPTVDVQNLRRLIVALIYYSTKRALTSCARRRKCSNSSKSTAGPGRFDRPDGA